MHKTKSGFTIVELLIVIVVIAILAAISVAAYNGIQNRANDTTVQNDLRTLSRKYEIYKIDNGNYPYGGALSVVANTGISMTFSQNAYQTALAYNVLNCVASGNMSYAVLAQSKSGKFFTVGSSDNTVKEVTDSVTLNNVNSCPTILAGSTASGAAYDNANGWRAWARGL